MSFVVLRTARSGAHFRSAVNEPVVAALLGNRMVSSGMASRRLPVPRYSPTETMAVVTTAWGSMIRSTILPIGSSRGSYTITPTTLATLHGVVWPETCGGETCDGETCGWATVGVANVRAIRAEKRGRIMVGSSANARDNAPNCGRFTGN